MPVIAFRTLAFDAAIEEPRRAEDDQESSVANQDLRLLPFDVHVAAEVGRELERRQILFGAVSPHESLRAGVLARAKNRICEWLPSSRDIAQAPPAEFPSRRPFLTNELFDQTKAWANRCKMLSPGIVFAVASHTCWSNWTTTRV
jgi:hypothetical protein